MLLGREHVSQTDADGRAATQFRLRKVGSARGVDSLDNRAVQHIGLAIVGPNESETNNRHHHRCGQLETIIALDPLREQMRQTQMFANAITHSGAAECAKNHPGLESAKPAAKLDAVVHVILLRFHRVAAATVQDRARRAR